MRGATLLSGGGGVEALLKDCVEFVHAVEYDPAIAAVYRANHGDHIQVADVCAVDYATWGALDYLHASPVCKNASQAKTGGEESDTDIQTALAVVRCLEQTEPRVFTLENVGGYQKFKAYKLICRALDLLGYMWHAEVLNSADYGVPQTRRRLILRAVKDALLPGLPMALPWVGWYAAIEDLIPTLPASQFANWQLARLPAEICGSTFFNQNESDNGRGGTYGVTARNEDEPSTTIKASVGASWYKAFLMPGGNTRTPLTVDSDPAFAITSAQNTRCRAFPVDGKPMNYAGDLQIVDEEAPVVTVTASQTRHPFRAWLSQGRVVKMTPRALARFQSLPDDFILPEKAGLACTVIGNAVPSLLMREIVRPLL